ncbi:MAG: PfkB family carbohydrate kinase, partial [Candidatus Diapherotrites archaeon]
ALGERFERAMRTRAIDTTGAGDIFNAGFMYGRVNGYSDRICLKIGNFAAGRKVGRSGLAVPDGQEVRKFISREKLTGLEIVADYDALSKAAAAEVIEQVREKHNSTIGLPAGRTPTGMYMELVKAYRKGGIDFSRARFFGLDEYAGRRKMEWDSFAHEIDESFFREVNVKKENVFLFNGNARNLNSECARFERFIGRAGIDLIVLGIGNNGHIAFNEPGTSFNSRAHVVKLSTNTINANARGGSIEDVPKKAVTIGLESIMGAKRILLIANGKNKANAIKRAYAGKAGKGCPASVLQGHRNAEFLVDRAAGKF